MERARLGSFEKVGEAFVAFARAGKAVGSLAQILRSIGGPSSDVKSAPG